MCLCSARYLIIIDGRAACLPPPRVCCRSPYAMPPSLIAPPDALYTGLAHAYKNRNRIAFSMEHNFRDLHRMQDEKTRSDKKHCHIQRARRNLSLV